MYFTVLHIFWRSNLPIIRIGLSEHLNLDIAKITSAFYSDRKLLNETATVKKEEDICLQGNNYIAEIIANFLELGKDRNKNLRYKKANYTQVNILKNKSCAADERTKSPLRPRPAIKKSVKNAQMVSETRKKKSLFTTTNTSVLECSKEVNLAIDNSPCKRGIENAGKNLFCINDKEIKILLDNKNYDDAFNVFELYWEQKAILSFSILRTLTSSFSQNGSSSKVKLLLEATEYFYPKEFSLNLCFTHYICEATFIEGNHLQALSLLKESMKNYPGAKRIKEVASFIMIRMLEAPEDLAFEAFEICCNFIKFLNQPKPAFSLWYCLIQSSFHRHHCLANELLVVHPKLLDQRLEKVNKLIETAYVDDNSDLLHRLNQCFLKIQNKELITGVSSAMLSLYCLSENVHSASEVIKFAHQEKLVLSTNSLRLFMHLIHKLKMPTPLSVLAFKYGFGTPRPSQSVKITKSPTFIFKFD